MPVFRYKAVNASGGVAVGELEAANESEIVERLRDQGLMPTQVARAAGALIAGATSGGPAAGGWRAQPLVRLEEGEPRPASSDHPRARDVAPRRNAARPCARDPDRPRRHRARCGVAARCPRRRPRRQVAVASCRRPPRRVFAVLRQHHPRWRSGRCARHRADTARGHDGAQQGIARKRDLGPHLSDHSYRRRRSVADADPGVRRPAVRADVRAGRSRVAAADAGRDLRRHRDQAMVVGDRRARRAVVHLDAPAPSQSRRAHALGRADAALASYRRRRDQSRDGAVCAHACNAHRQRRDALVRTCDRQGYAWQHRAREPRSMA